MALLSDLTPKHVTGNMTPTEESILADVTRSQTPETEFTVWKVAVSFWTYCVPVIVKVGTFGNLSTILVLRRYGKNSSSLPLYLTTLACADMSLLYFGLLGHWVNIVLDHNIKSTHTALCKLVVWVVYSSGTLSAWLLVTVTLQRVLCVVWPHRTASVCSVRKSKIVLMIVLVCPWCLQSGLAFSFYLNSDNVCTVYEDRKPFYNVWALVDMILSSLLPAFILYVCNFILISKLRVSLREARRMNVGSLSSRRKAVSSTSLTLVLLSTAFLALTLPISAEQLWERILRGEEDLMLPSHQEAQIFLTWTITDILWYCNSAVNFLFYCVSGSKFRREFVALFCCRSSNARSTTSIVSVSASVHAQECPSTVSNELEVEF